MKKFALIIFILVIYITLRVTGVIKTPEAWPRYSPKTSGFSVLVPGKMTEAEEAIGSGEDSIIFHNAEMEWSGVVYATGYGDLPGYFFERLTDREILDKMINMVLTDNSRKLIKKEDLLLQEFPAVYAEYENSEGNKILVRYCLKKPRIYRLIVSTGKENLESSRSDYEKFLNSLKLDTFDGA